MDQKSTLIWSLITTAWKVHVGLVQGLAKHCSRPCFSTPYKATSHKRKATIRHISKRLFVVVKHKNSNLLLDLTCHGVSTEFEENGLMCATHHKSSLKVAYLTTVLLPPWAKFDTEVGLEDVRWGKTCNLSISWTCVTCLLRTFMSRGLKPKVHIMAT